MGLSNLKFQLPYDLFVILLLEIPHFLVLLPLAVVLLYFSLQQAQLAADSLQFYLDSAQLVYLSHRPLQRV